ncbi:MAG: hypothetical protein AVDCRST_MAG37-3436, partial [uncultured Rubrobacteraceae bacterium]
GVPLLGAARRCAYGVRNQGPVAGIRATRI